MDERLLGFVGAKPRLPKSNSPGYRPGPEFNNYERRTLMHIRIRVDLVIQTRLRWIIALVYCWLHR